MDGQLNIPAPLPVPLPAPLPAPLRALHTQETSERQAQVAAQTKKTSTQGTLFLVDLAGSERLGRSKATGIHLKETQAINKVRVCTTIGLELLTFSILSP